MKNSKIKPKGAIMMAILFVSMLVVQSCATSQIGCPTHITKANAEQEVSS